MERMLCQRLWGVKRLPLFHIRNNKQCIPKQTHCFFSKAHFVCTIIHSSTMVFFCFVFWGSRIYTNTFLLNPCMAIFEIFLILNKSRERIKIGNRIILLTSRPLLLPKRKKLLKQLQLKTSLSNFLSLQ